MSIHPVRFALSLSTSLLFILSGLRAANCPPIAFGPVPFPSKSVAIAAYGASPDVAATADFNRDKKADVVYCSSTAVFVLLGDGQGGFANSVNVAAVAASSVKVADLNKDGNPDLVLGTGTVNVRVALGNGDGTFKPSVAYPAVAVGGGAAQIVATGDFDGDTLLDIAATLAGANAIGILPGRGDGTFGAAHSTAVTTPNGGLVPGDFDGDGFLDLATTSNGAQIAVLINRGNGTFLASTNTPVNLTGTAIYSIRAADLNGDGILDVTGVSTPASAQKRFMSFLGDGDGTFTLASQKPITTIGTYSTAVTDINGDGRLDVLVAANTTMTVMEGLGDGTFADQLPFAATSVGTLTSGDYNGDGRPDVVVFAGTNALRIMLNETLFLPPDPVLSWRLTTGPLRLVWYSTYSDFKLEYLGFDPGASWQPVTAEPNQVDCQYFFTVPADHEGLYRLVKP